MALIVYSIASSTSLSDSISYITFYFRNGVLSPRWKMDDSVKRGGWLASDFLPQFFAALTLLSLDLESYSLKKPQT